MPKLMRGWEILPVEHLLKNPRDFLSKVHMISGCRCLLVDTPFVALVEVDDVRVPISLGVGSIVCADGCGIGSWRLAEPAWGYGVWVGESTCKYFGPSEVAEELKSLGLKVEHVATLYDAIEASRRAWVNSLIVLSSADVLEVERGEGFCGQLDAPNPLHPASVVGKPQPTACIKDYAEPVGRFAKMLTPILRLSRRSIVWRSKLLGELLVYSYNPLEASEYTRISSILGALYICSRKAD